MIRRLLSLVALIGLTSTPVIAQKRPLVIIDGQTRQLPSATTLGVQPSTTSSASINIPQGSAPATPNDGNLMTTTSGVYARINGLTGGPFAPAGQDINVSPQFCSYASMTGVSTSDNSTCIQNAINYACSVGSSPSGYAGGALVLARGVYYIKRITIPSTCSGLRIHGQGYRTGNATTIVTDNNCTQPVIDFYSDATQNYVYGGGVSDVYLFNNTLLGGNFNGTTSCPQPIIRASYGRNMTFTRIMALSPKVLIKIIAGLNNVVSDIAVDQALQNSTGVFEAMGMGALPDATGQQTRQDLTRFSNLTVFGAPAQTGQQWYTRDLEPRPFADYQHQQREIRERLDRA